MSEEVLKALMQLFAIIAKQDVGISLNEREYVNSFLKLQLNDSTVKEYLALFDSFISEKDARKNVDSEEKPKLTSVKDSVKTLGICKKINKTLTQKQKVVVLVRLFELINSDKNFTTQRIAIIDTVADVFNISKDEYSAIESFIAHDNVEQIDSSDIMVIKNDRSGLKGNCKFIESNNLDGQLLILRVASVDLYFIKYVGHDEVLLNGLPLNKDRIYLFASGSVIKPPKGKPGFYTDVAQQFLSDNSFINVLFEAKKINYTFPNGHIGLKNITLTEGSGKLVGIMGASGTGKTTLLNVLSGIEPPSEGTISINGVDLHRGENKLKGIIGYIPQDDLLIEELSVYENLYYNAKLVFKDFTEKQIDDRVMKVLTNLGLSHIKDLKVGSPLNKKISGGQRKRLNIGLELTREPAILFVDEPTSGLSSRDSENVMELLSELTLKGKLIFVVIHQPSSDIYKMFDNVIIIDEGGLQIYYGNPVEAVMYFKQLDNQINSGVGECSICGNVNPESIFNIIEARIVDEYGQFTGTRKVTSKEWNEHFIEIKAVKSNENRTYDILPDAPLVPSWFKQVKTFFLRDLFSKFSNNQYMIISLAEAPLISLLLAFVIHYIDNPISSVYKYRENDNIMPYLFMCTIVALFIGLMVSAEEIFKDRKILKREKFLHLSRSSYLTSKISILFILSAIQSFLFVIVGNLILGIHGMLFEYWMIFFSISAFANVLGLNISSAFNSAVTIYILIPFLIIPQMVLTGAMFSFDKINRYLGGGQEKVPVIAEFMPSRWAFEALVVNQFINNKYENIFYDLEKKESYYNYKNVYYLPELKGIIQNYKVNSAQKKMQCITEEDLSLLKFEISKEQSINQKVKFASIDKISSESFNNDVADEIIDYIEELQSIYKESFKQVNEKKDQILTSMQNTEVKKEEFQVLYDSYYNKHLGSFAKNTFATNPMVRINNHFVQKIDPIYLDPQQPGIIDFRTHFLAPRKSFMGTFFSTYWFNIAILWIFTIIMYIMLYFEHVKKLLGLPEKIKPKLDSLIKKIRLLKKSNKHSIKNEKNEKVI